MYSILKENWIYLLRNLQSLWVFLIVSCQSPSPSLEAVNFTILEKYETFISADENIFGAPHILRYDDVNSTLFIYDSAVAKVYELDENGVIVNQFGSRGRGPGEFFQVINNLFVTDDDIYVVDQDQSFIHKFGRDGTFIFSMNYGEIHRAMNPGPFSPFSPSFLRAEDVHNQPIVTMEGDVLLPRVGLGQQVEKVFELRDWEGNHLADIGVIPKGSTFVVDYEELSTAVSNREIPGLYRPNAFAIHDPVNQQEFFLIYNSLGVIKKYNANGTELWKTNIQETAEVDSTTNKFFEAMDRLLRDNDRIEFIKYNRGVSNVDGDLYLAVNSYGNDLWIHHFTEKGKLFHRYKLVGGETSILPVFEIDSAKRRIFVVTEEAEIRVYTF